MLVIACFGYLANTLMVFLVPGLDTITTIFAIPAAIGEFWMVGYLLLVGVRSRNAVEPAAVTA